jgi:uncharacterized membrane protein YvlD (DUF360 family)
MGTYLPLNFNYWFLQGLAMTMTSLLIPNLKLTSIFGPLVMVVSIALINSFIWDAALFFSIPNNLSSQALVLLLANGGIFWLLVKLLPGIEVRGVLPALVAPLVYTGCSLLVAHYGTSVDWLGLFGELLKKLEALRQWLQHNSSPKVAAMRVPSW